MIIRQKKLEKNPLHSSLHSIIMIRAVALIAVKREVAARCGRFSVERMSC